MTSTATQTPQAEAPLTWTAKKEWGSVGMTHRAQITLDNGDTWRFVVDSPRKGVWTARGWRADADQTAAGRTGDMVFYREDTTMKGAKAQSQAHANLAQTSTCAECGRIAGHKLDCGTGQQAATDRTVKVFSRVPLRATDEGAAILGQVPADQIRRLSTSMADVKRAAAAAAPAISSLVRALIRNQPCGCQTPIHRMHCGNGATPRVIRKAADQ